MSFHSATPLGPENTGTDTWLTPPWIIEKIGLSDLDPCAWLVDGKPIVETARNYITEDQDGLKTDWNNQNTFVNFPYSQGKHWLKKCSEHNNGIVLCFVRCETAAWQKYVKNATGINLMNKRVKFLTGEGIEKSNGNAPSCLIAWGEDNYERIKRVDGICVRIDKDL